MSLTPYGPGKFNLLVDTIPHAYTMEGAHDDETGDCETTGWFGLVKGKLDPTGIDGSDKLSADDRAFLARMIGAIVCEDSQGFVSVDYYDREEDMREEWERIVNGVSRKLAEDANT